MKKWPLGVFIVVALFARIYFYNTLIRMNYEKQRLERTLNTINKTYAEASAILYALKDAEKLQQTALERGMVPITMAYMMTSTLTTTVDILGLLPQGEV